MHRLAEKRVLSFVKVIGRRENVKGKKFSIAYQGAFESEKKSKTTLPGFVLTHHLVFRGYFVILTNLKILQNFALHGENWKVEILKNQMIHQIKRVNYCKWNFKGFKILTNFKAWANLIPFDFWKRKKSFFSQIVRQIEKVSAGYETKLLILDMKSALFFRYNAPLRF